MNKRHHVTDKILLTATSNGKHLIQHETSHGRQHATESNRLQRTATDCNGQHPADCGGSTCWIEQYRYLGAQRGTINFATASSIRQGKARRGKRSEKDTHKDKQEDKHEPRVWNIGTSKRMRQELSGMFCTYALERLNPCKFSNLRRPSRTATRRKVHPKF